jgi:hypothetical protein
VVKVRYFIKHTLSVHLYSLRSEERAKQLSQPLPKKSVLADWLEMVEDKIRCNVAIGHKKRNHVMSGKSKFYADIVPMLRLAC